MKTLFAFLLILGLSLDVRAANLIHNSSFELGISGWTVWGSEAGGTMGDEAAPASRIVSTNGSATHGSHSIWFISRLIGRPLWLTNGTYTFTFDARGVSAWTMSASVMQTYLITATPPDTFAVTTSWKRFTNTFVAPTNAWYFPKFMMPLTSVRTWIDAVQLEAGPTASAYSPQLLEVGMNTADSGNNLFLSDAKTLTFNLWNAGPQTNVTVHYEIIHGVWNTNISTGTISTNALTALTNTTINLSLPNMWGDLRITCYITNVHDTWDETSVSIFPYPPGSGRNTNGLLGIATHMSPYHLSHARRIGFTRTRYLSPMTDARWVQVFPTLNSTNMQFGPPGHWYLDYAMEFAATNDLVPIVTLVGDINWYPETNASLMVMIGDYTNYVGRLVHRYKESAFNVHEWEIWNEPNQSTTVIDLANPDLYAALFTNSARLIKTIDPQATVIGFGGLSSAAQVTSFWNALSPQGKADMDIAAVHNYPQSFGTTDPNLPDDDNTYSTVNIGAIARAFGGTRPIWNDETGVYDVGGYHTINVAYAFPFYFHAKTNDQGVGWTSEAHFNELNARQLASTDRLIYNFCRSVGWGYSHFNIQYARYFDDALWSGNFPSIYEPNGCLRPWAVALLIGEHMVKVPGRGRLTNSANYWVEAYLHTNSWGVVVPIWNCDRGNRTLTFDNGAVALYDTFGNFIQTNSTSIPITRSVRYLVSGTRTAVQISNTIWSASFATNSDSLAPGLTIDISPVGNTVVWSGVTNVFKVTAIDETVIPFANAAGENAAETNVLYQWTFNDGASWSPWGMTNHFFKSYATPGWYRVGWKAKDVANNETPIVYTPYFGDPAFISAPSGLHVSGTARIGTLTIAP